MPEAGAEEEEHQDGTSTMQLVIQAAAPRLSIDQSRKAL